MNKLFIILLASLFISYGAAATACTASDSAQTTPCDCITNAVTGNVADKCISCNTANLAADICAKCTAGYTQIADVAKRGCQICTNIVASCAACDQTAVATVCTACAATFGMNSGGSTCTQCTATTPAVVCHDCVQATPTECTKCSANDASTEANNSYLDATAKTCVLKAACPAATVAVVGSETHKLGTCGACDASCATCDGTAATNCLTCVADKGLFADTTAKTCKECVANCKTCVDATTCSACKDTTFTLSDDKTKCEAASTSSGSKLTVGLTMAAVAGYILA